MCLIAFAIQARPGLPLLLAANRDEFFDRPTAPLHRWGASDGVEVLAGRDLRDGGTWLGVSAAGRVAMLTNVRAPGRITTLAAELMVRTGVAGAVTHIGSVAAAGGAPELFPYAASKQALVAMTKNSSFALLRHRIRVNLIQPGWMNTPAEDGIQRRFHGATDGWLAAASAKQPFGRLIDPHELARTVVFVSSDEAGLMTGAVIEYDQTVLGPDMSRSDLEPVWGEPASGRGEAPADADRGANDVR